jgi:mRNA-degrading endonuclease YafQ of YafQ-DinJ toxin-antitoxin module
MLGAILECVNQLGQDPRHPGLHTHKVKGHKGVWEAHVDKANRLTFEWDDDVLVLRNNCNHEVLRRP